MRRPPPPSGKAEDEETRSHRAEGTSLPPDHRHTDPCVSEVIVHEGTRSVDLSASFHHCVHAMITNCGMHLADFFQQQVETNSSFTVVHDGLEYIGWKGQTLR